MTTTTNDFDTGIEMPQYGDDVQGDGLLRIQWRNGEQRSKTGGYFFVSEDRLGDTVPSDPWVPFADTFNDGEEVAGFKAETLNLAVLCARAQPFHWSAANGTPGRYKIWQTKWMKGDAAPEYQSMQVEVLAWVAGFDHPVVWSSATIKTSFAIIGNDGILRGIDSALVKPANATAKHKLDRYAFWAEVATERGPKGVVYTPTPGKAVTLPTLLLPPEPKRDRAWLVSRFIGSAPDGKAFLADTLIPLREQYEAWRLERRTNDADEAPPTRPAPSGRNVPQAIAEDEFSDVL